MAAAPTHQGRDSVFKLRRIAALFELQDAATARWLPMEGLRGFAVALVFLVHYASLLGERMNAEWLEALHELGIVGVDLFFVLSGFLIYKACIQRPINLRHYAYRRIERIYPTFLAALAIYLLLMVAMPSESKLPDGLGAQIEYILANLLLLPGMLAIEPIMTVAWSLSYEMFYYLLAPLVIITLRMRFWAPQYRLALFLALYAAMIAIALAGFDGRFRVTMFLGGMILYDFVALRPANAQRASAPSDMTTFLLVGVAFVLYVLLAVEPVAVPNMLTGALPPFARLVLINAVFVLLVYRSVFTAGPASAVFSWTPLRWLGNVSYSFYLMHGLALHAFFMLLGKVWKAPDAGIGAFLLLMPPAFLASLAIALPIYLLVERPLSLKTGAPSKTPEEARSKLASKLLGP